MLGHERLELGHRLGRLPLVDARLQAAFQGEEPKLLEPGRLRPCELLVVTVVERGTPPQRQRLLDAALVQQMLELVGVELTRLDTEEVSRSACDEPFLTDDPAQLRDVALEARASRRGRLLAPELLDQAVGGYGVVPVQDQDCEQRAQPSARQRDRLAVTPDCQGT